MNFKLLIVLVTISLVLAQGGNGGNGGSKGGDKIKGCKDPCESFKLSLDNDIAWLSQRQQNFTRWLADLNEIKTKYMLAIEEFETGTMTPPPNKKRQTSCGPLDVSPLENLYSPPAKRDLQKKLAELNRKAYRASKRQEVETDPGTDCRDQVAVRAMLIGNMESNIMGMEAATQEIVNQITDWIEQYKDDNIFEGFPSIIRPFSVVCTDALIYTTGNGNGVSWCIADFEIERFDDIGTGSSETAAVRMNILQCPPDEQPLASANNPKSDYPINYDCLLDATNLSATNCYLEDNTASHAYLYFRSQADTIVYNPQAECFSGGFHPDCFALPDEDQLKWEATLEFCVKEQGTWDCLTWSGGFNVNMYLDA